MSDKLKEYIPLIRFISEIMSPDTEIILYDVDKKSVAYVQNSFDDEIINGSEMPSFQQKLIDEKMYLKHDYIVNYRAISKGKHKLKSATYFLKDSNNNSKLIGILTVNMNVDKLIELRDLLDSLISGGQGEESSNNNGFSNMTFEQLMEYTIKEAISSFNLPPDRLSHEEKMELTSRLDKKGVFKVKGSVTELAQLLQITETSIYRYINKI